MRLPPWLLLLSACASAPAHVPPTPECPRGATTATPMASAAPVASASAPTDPGETYDKPPKDILDVMLAPSPPQPMVNPPGDRILLVSWVDYPPMTRVAEPFLRLAGVRVEPRTRARHDTPGGYGISPCARDLTITNVATGADTRVTLPRGCVDGPSWSADGTRFLFRNNSGTAVELWVGDAATGAVHAVEGVHLNPMLGRTAQWMPDQKSLLVKLVPADAGSPPAERSAPFAPNVQETGGTKGESSTYETRDTLTSKHDEDLFDYYATSQLAIVELASGAVRPLGKPGIVRRVDASPDGEHFLVETIHKPYSYVTTYDRFPYDVAIWDRSGKATHTVASLRLADRVPVHGVPTGPREFEWRPTEPATLVWAEALDGGDWKAKVPARDKLMMARAPFDAPPAEVMRVEQRFDDISFGAAGGMALVRENDENRHWTRTFVVDVDHPKTKPSLLWDLSTDEHYKDPGWPVYRPLPNGFWVLRQSGDSIFTRAAGSSPDGDRPFLDRIDLKTRKSERLFRCDTSSYESFLGFVGPDQGTLLTWHQSPVDPPNAFAHTLGAPLANAPAGEATTSSTSRAVTHLPDPTPAVRAIKKRLVKYKRADGMVLSFTLYTPPGYQEGQRIPAVLYAYPLDYADPSKAGQVTGSEKTFTRLRLYKLLLLAGYAVIDGASFPIVGDPKRAYDTYIEQLVADAKAAVNKAVELGVVDPQRIGITGHSHGALMTVNLLAHSDLFRAGVATSGSYNKTLTPFGFQNERRSVWDAQNVYLKASPFFFANKLTLPLLIMHGEDDANPGTTPLQATKLYEAIRGNGGTARLVMLPHEPHWYTALESNEQYVAEMLRWFDKYVKNAPSKK
ncbi:MAG TPA: prolyl oligopeptidase family serine peptidase [Polyangiaceae bacterium]|nr:prolyl oligopeptidase family serine peptidase [Polyangiaceae bacterium]